MRELIQLFPDPEVLLALEPEELAGKLILVMRKRLRMEPHESFHLGNAQIELRPDLSGTAPSFPPEHRGEFELALAEAWAWLEAQGLLVSAPSQNSAAGFRVLSRRARRFENETEFANYRMARWLPKEALHPKIQVTVWLAFMRGEFDVAVFQGMKAVEVAVRKAASLPAKDVGTHLMRKAFDPEAGPLTDKATEKAEREALSALFAGAIGSYKNPHSHRDVQLTDPAEAIEIIMLANHLLRIVDGRKPQP